MFRHSFHHGLVALGACLTGVAGACTFSAPDAYQPPEQQMHDAINASPLLPLAESSRYTITETPGKVKLMHGQSCAFAPRASGDHHIGFRVHESVPMPAGYEGTVYLNGFRGDYDSDDRNMLGIGAMLIHVDSNKDKGELSWEAGGVLGDDSGDDAYKWCYWYAIAMWNTQAPELDISAFQTDEDPKLTTFIHDDDSDPGNETALRELPGVFADPGRRAPKAVLPRGFGLLFADGDDHNLLQEGFDLGMPNPAGAEITWNAQTVLKDNAKRHDYRGSMLVSYLLGSSVSEWKPEKVWKRDAKDPGSAFEIAANDFQLVPRAQADWCGADEIDYKKWEYVVDDVPFDYALPILSGWDNGNFCEDTNVEKTGVWLTEVSYDKQANGLGKLRYTVASMFTDNGGLLDSDGNLTGHSVVILGINEKKAPPKGGSQPNIEVKGDVLPTKK